MSCGAAGELETSHEDGRPRKRRRPTCRTCGADLTGTHNEGRCGIWYGAMKDNVGRRIPVLVYNDDWRLMGRSA